MLSSLLECYDEGLAATVCSAGPWEFEVANNYLKRCLESDWD